MIWTRVRLFVAVLVLSSCAHAPPASVGDCSAQVTPELLQTAASALLGADYEGAVARELGGLAACLVVAAVEAAVNEARALKLSAKIGGAGAQITITQHGDAWLAKHRPPPRPR